MQPRGALTSITLGTVVLAGIAGVAVLADGGAVRPAAALERFDGCDALMASLRGELLERLTPYGLSEGGMGYGEALAGQPMDGEATATTAAAAGDNLSAGQPTSGGGSSTTNTQEVGVDEGDLVEHDGQYLYTTTGGRLVVVDLAEVQQVASVPLPSGNAGWGPGPSEPQLLLAGDRLAAVTTSYGSRGTDTTVSILDVSDPTAPQLLGRTHLEGESLATRAIGDRLHVVVRSPFATRLPFVQPSYGYTGPSDEAAAEAVAANRRVVEEATAADLLPRAFAEAADGTTSPEAQAIACDEVAVPSRFAGLGLVWIATVDLGSPDAEPRGTAGVVASGETVYASANALYVATMRWPDAAGLTRPIQPPPPSTDVHRFDLLGDGDVEYRASGTVAGWLLNQFALSEWGDRLRVATTVDGAGFAGTTESGVHVLEVDGAELREIGTLGGLGRTEQIYAVRFLGDLAYVVTFRQTDPLYVIDLRDPTRPVLAGELKVPGYSAYLHPIGDGLVLGIGQDGTNEGRVLGTQLSLFDVSDPTAPVRRSSIPLGDSSEAEQDHHAFLWWPATSQVVVPVMSWSDPAGPGSTAVVVHLDETGQLAEQGRVTHPSVGHEAAVVRRALVADDRLVTVGNQAVMVTDLATLEPYGSVALSP